jgi:uncharacterized membrane protein YesL
MGKLLATIYKKTFWNTYDHIGQLVLINLLWFLVFPFPTFLAFRYLPFDGYTQLSFVFLIGLLTHSYATAGVFALTARLADYQDLSLKDFFPAARVFYFRTLMLDLIFGGIFFLLTYSVGFYISVKIGFGLLGFFLAGIQVWIGAFCILMQVYAKPLLYSRDWGLWAVLKWSATLILIRPGYTILLFLQATAIYVLLGVTGVGVVLLLMSLVTMFLNTALRETLRDMDKTMKPKRKPTSWKEIFAEQDKEEEERRTIKDLFRPWDS